MSARCSDDLVSDRDLVLLARNAQAIHTIGETGGEHSHYYLPWEREQAKRDERRYRAECERRGIDVASYDTTPAL